MQRFTRAPLALLAVAALCIGAPAAADDTERVRFQPRLDAPAYVFHAEQLGWPSEVEARFEYRSGSVVVGEDRVLLSFADSGTVRVPIRPVVDLAQTPDARVLVFVGDLQLAAFDREQLAAYVRTMNYTRPAASGRTTEKIDCGSPCNGGCGPTGDYDCDGVNNATDNCTDDPNSNQADCDGDGYGDVCDAIDATYQASGSVDTCMADKDDHGAYKTFEHHVEQRQVDVSSCGAPDQWNRWIRDDNDCWSSDDYSCCEGLRFSMAAIGDDFEYWCEEGVRNIDFCH